MVELGMAVLGFKKNQIRAILNPMKLIFNDLNDSSLNVLRRAGYVFLRRDERTGESSFVKRVGNADFPRFHIYVKTVGAGAEVNLHLDQKKTSYGGSIAHSGEYDSDGWVAREAEAIKKAFGD